VAGAHVITFRSDRFDAAVEPPNPINPIAGESVLRWLREPLGRSGYEVTEPQPEDWGWYIGVSGPGGAYLVGASADAEAGPGPVDWTLQIHKPRSLRDRITGANRLATDDPLSGLIERLVRDGAAAADVEVDRDG
jgi:hypothetical protein